MATLQELNATINKHSRATDFAKHFATTNASRKNILTALGLGHEKTLTEAFDDVKGEKSKYADIMQADANLSCGLINLVNEAFTATVDEAERLQNEGRGKGLPERVSMMVRDFLTRANGDADIMNKIAALVTSNDTVRSLLDELEKDGVAKDEVEGMAINTLLVVAMKRIIADGFNWVAPTAVDQNGNPVDVEIITEGAAHSADESNPDPNQPEQTTTGDGSNAAENVTGNNDTPDHQESCTALIIKDIKNAKNSEELLEGIKKLLNGAGDAALENDLINILKQYASTIVNDMISGFGAVVPDSDTVRADENYRYAKNVILGLFPHNWNSSVDVDRFVDTVALQFVNAGLDPEMGYDECCVVLTTYAVLIYRFIAMTGDNTQDIVDGYRMALCIADTAAKGDFDPKKMARIVYFRVNDVEELMKRVNRQIEQPWQRTHGTFDVMISGLWASSAKDLLENGMALIKKAMAA